LETDLIFKKKKSTRETYDSRPNNLIGIEFKTIPARRVHVNPLSALLLILKEANLAETEKHPSAIPSEQRPRTRRDEVVQ
jgi:hypothetical protein